MKTPKETLPPSKIDNIKDFESLKEFLKQLLLQAEEEHTNIYEDLKTLFEKTGA